MLGRVFLLTLVLNISFSFISGKSYAISAEEIIERVDDVRGPGKPFEVNLEIVDFKEDKEIRRMKLEISIKGKGQTLKEFKSLSKSTYPPENRGTILLYSQGDLWIYIPKVRRPIRISPRQRLIGQVANGDVIGVNFADDYDSELVSEEVLDGKKCYVLELKARRESVTYHRVKLWVDKSNYHPLVTEHYGFSGRLIKTGYYRSFVESLGKERPKELEIVDAINSTLRTKMFYSNYQLKKLSDRMFQKDYLQHIR